MELLLLLLLTPPLIIAHRYHTTSAASTNPNDEPFLPIYPIYPYSPKLIKRGTDRDIVTPLTPELYAPKLDARDSYTSSFGGNYQRDPYYPTYNPYPKTASTTLPVTASLPNSGYTGTGSYPATTYASPSVYAGTNGAYANTNMAYTTANDYSPYSVGYNNPYPYSVTPYGIYNSYSTPNAPPPNSYPAGPYAPANYPNYNYQAPYYYPNYYNQPYPPLPPTPSASTGQEYSASSENDDSAEEPEAPKPKASGGVKKSESKKNRYKSNDSEIVNESRDEQFVDGANFLSSTSKDLDGQSTSYKAPSPYNQVEQLSDLHLRSVALPGVPRTTYRVISVGGQPVGADYPLPQSYAKIQQLEQMMSQTLAKLLAQNGANQTPGRVNYQYQQQDGQTNFGGTGLNNKSPQSVIAKTGLAYVVDPTNLPKIPNAGGQYINNYGNGRNPIVIKVQDQVLQQGTTVLSKASPKYTDRHYGQKALTTVSIQQTPGVYIPPEAKNIKDENSSQTSEYNDYDSANGQNYDASNAGYKKNEENYSIDQSNGVPYHSSNLVTVQTPQAQSYQYSSYLPTQSSQQQQPRDYKTSLDDVNFSTKRNSKV